MTRRRSTKAHDTNTDGQQTIVSTKKHGPTKPKDDTVASSQVEAIPTSDTTCHLLALPPELRNRVYDLCLIDRPPKEVNFLKACPPSKALPMTCRQIYEEAKHMYRKAHHEFWLGPKFYIPVPRGEITTVTAVKINAAAARFHRDDVAHIKSLRMSAGSGTAGRFWTFANDIWSFWDLTGDEQATVRTCQEIWLPRAKEKAVRAAGFRLTKLKRKEWLGVRFKHASAAQIETVRRIVGKRGMSVEELLVALLES